MKAQERVRTVSIGDRTVVSIANALVEHVCSQLESSNPFNVEIVAAFRAAPTVELYDRLTAFRAESMDSEYRAAIERVERGVYGRCTSCGRAIPAGQLRDLPLQRYCSGCLRRLESNARPDRFSPAALHHHYRSQGAILNGTSEAVHHRP